MIIGLIDLEVGNLGSLTSALANLNVNLKIVDAKSNMIEKRLKGISTYKMIHNLCLETIQLLSELIVYTCSIFHASRSDNIDFTFWIMLG